MDYSDPKNSERMVRALAYRVQRRLKSLPQKVMSFDDIEQELWLAWCKARDRFNSELGIPWEAYLQRGMKQHINRVLDVQVERFEGQTFAASLDAPIEGEDMTLAQVIPSEDEDPSVTAERESNYRQAMTLLSERARIYVSLLRDQPEELQNEVLKAQDKAEHAAKLGAPYNTPNSVTSAMIFTLMGAERTERRKITKEVQALGERLSR